MRDEKLGMLIEQKLESTTYPLSREDKVLAGSSYGVSLDGQETNVSSLFAQDVWRVTPDVRLIAGVRLDDANEWGSELSPRLALGWRVTSGVELRGSYGQGFRQPSVGELYFPLSGNPQLEAERSESAEVGLDFNLGSSRLQLNLFSTEIDSLFDPGYALRNMGVIFERVAALEW